MNMKISQYLNAFQIKLQLTTLFLIHILQFYFEVFPTRKRYKSIKVRILEKRGLTIVFTVKKNFAMRLI